MKVFRLSYTELTGWSQDLPSVDSPKTLVLAFFSPKLASSGQWFADLKRAFPQSHVLGCSTAGEIHGMEVRDESVTVAITQFDRINLRSTYELVGSPDESFSVGQKIAQSMHSGDLKGLFVISDGLNVNGSALAAGINSHLPDVLVTGGLAGDGSSFQKTWVINSTKVESGYVGAIGFYGAGVQMSFGSQGGWDIFGPERVVTRSKGNVLFELDGQPALDIYKTYLGDRAADLPASGLLFPLQIRDPKMPDQRLVRTILAVNEKEKSLIFAGDIPQKCLAQLMKANFDRLIDGATSAADQTGALSQATLAIAVSCVGRRLVLRDRIEEETEATFVRLPKGSEQIGFYSYGELAPHSKFIKCELHNQTMTITTISEAS
jgi:hypothetical protein